MTASLIVADAGPLIALAVGGVLQPCLDMLGGLCVPEPVLLECVADVSAPGAALIEQAHKEGLFTVIAHAQLSPLDAAFAQGLGTGEIAVLSYAAQHKLLALIDERRARRVALHLQVPVIGSGTLLVQLKQQGLLGSVGPVFEAWHRHGYFVSEPVKQSIFLAAGEP